MQERNISDSTVVVWHADHIQRTVIVICEEREKKKKKIKVFKLEFSDFEQD